jgi:protein-S-isoprenylcysteine O-methyltransferase Ste14
VNCINGGRSTEHVLLQENNAMNYFLLITVLGWVVFFTYWGVKANKVKTAVYSQGTLSRRVYLFFLFFSLFSVYIPYFGVGILGYRVIPESNAWGILGVLISITGVSFAIWARRTLGTNWSAKVTLKKEHELVKSGPYSIVRHPIYTGFELATLGPVLIVGQLKGFIALLIIFCAHVYKIGMEEKLMNQQFPGKYADYSKRVKRLLPFIY